MHSAEFFQKLVEDEIVKYNGTFPQEPAALYDPIRYMMKLGGKRMRPVLTLLSCEIFGGDYKNAISPAIGLEVFHNFTLLHDDIMDNAPLRRAMPAVHKKWNADVAILAGDAMFVEACRLVLNVNSAVSKEVMDLFLRTSIQVCEGQQWDMTYQSTEHVTIQEYLNMIELKTSALLACSLKTGALIAGASHENADLIYDFGKNMGLAFQLHDDMLDVYGDKSKFGKQVGGDIVANKKTFLLLKAFELADDRARKELTLWLHKSSFIDSEKIDAVKSIYDSLKVKEHAEEEMSAYYKKAMQDLDDIELPEYEKESLKMFAQKLMVRQT
jgi:geranylgeranyl diphosphate synthase, type II